MAKSDNPLKGKTKEEVIALIEEAGIDDTEGESEGPLEIVIRGAGADKILKALKPSRNYDPDEESEEQEETKAPAKRSWAERYFGIDSEAS